MIGSIKVTGVKWLCKELISWANICDRDSGPTNWICANFATRSADILRSLKSIHWCQNLNMRWITLCKHRKVYLSHECFEFVTFFEFQWSACFSCATPTLQLFRNIQSTIEFIKMIFSKQWDICDRHDADSTDISSPAEIWAISSRPITKSRTSSNFTKNC
jgi:hypothetical protein